MIGSDGIRGYTDIIILSLLKEKDSYGYEISTNIRLRTEEKYVMKETTLYSAFNRMEKSGWVHSYQGDVTHGRRRTYYHITSEGLAYYQEKCEEWEITKDIVERFI